MTGLGRFAKALRIAAGSLMITLAAAWLSLYIDSVLQRRKAERLIADLKSFPFATAGFKEVRDLVARNGGHAVQSLPQRTPPDCTVRDCTFWVEINHPLVRTLQRMHASEATYRTLLFFGIRPWGVRADLTVTAGTLEEIWTQAAQAKFGKEEGSIVPIEFAYDAWIRRRGRDNNGDPSYEVFRPHVSGGPAEVLETWAFLEPGVPTNRAFDINTSCFTSILHGCRDFAELAPSAWADHEHQKLK